MTFNCSKCGKPFRDNYALNRHNLKKNPCVYVEPVKDSSNINININVNVVLGNENKIQDLNKFIDWWRTCSDMTEETYIIAGQLINKYQEMVNENNIIIKSPKDMTALVFTDQGWVKEHVDQAIDKLIKIRSGQIIQLKDDINITKPKLFNFSKNIITWKHLESFHKYGREHQGMGEQTRQFRSAIKVKLIK